MIAGQAELPDAALEVAPSLMLLASSRDLAKLELTVSRFASEEEG